MKRANILKATLQGGLKNTGINLSQVGQGLAPAAYKLIYQSKRQRQASALHEMIK